MTEQEIELCLKRLATCKTTDVMNFDYAGTLAYIERLKAETQPCASGRCVKYIIPDVLMERIKEETYD